MTIAILQQLAGLEKLQAVKVLVAALHEVTEGMRGEDLPGIVPLVQKLVPVKKSRRDPFAPVWAYLETVTEYESLATLRAVLIARFGEAGTPSKSHLHRHLQRNRREL
jgi:hypothetical protein